MKKKSICSILNRGMASFLVLLLVALPALAQSTPEQEQPEKMVSDAEQKEPEKPLSDEEQGKLDGKRDGKRSSIDYSWFFWGCITGPLWLVLAESTNPRWPDSLTGKTEAYVNAYEVAYRQAVEERNTVLASAGCLIGSVISIILFLKFLEDMTSWEF